MKKAIINKLLIIINKNTLIIKSLCFLILIKIEFYNNIKMRHENITFGFGFLTNLKDIKKIIYDI